jgi:predicted transcriptional regulator of viral defense system
MKDERLSLYRIRDLALKSKRAVFSIQQLANLIGKSKAVASVYSYRLVKKGLAKRLLSGKISFSDDEYVIASQLIEPSYISLYSALLFHNVISQVPRDIECVTTRNSIRYASFGIVYHKIPPSLFYGYIKYGKGNSYIFVAEPEKALIDSVYLNAISQNQARELLNKMNRKRLEDFVKRYNGRGRKKIERWLLR